MPRKSNKQADLSAVLDTNPVLDMDNVYWSKVGWAYRHYKSEDKARYWDEILVAGEALADDGTPDATAQDFGIATPVFESGDSVPSVDVPEITSFVVAGPEAAEPGAAEAGYTATLVGEDVAGATYEWSSSDEAAVFSAATGTSTSITFSDEGTYEVTCSVSITAGDLTVSEADTIEVVVTAPA